MIMMVTVVDIRISIGLKQSSVRTENDKIIGVNYLAMETQEVITATLVKLELHVI